MTCNLSPLSCLVASITNTNVQSSVHTNSNPSALFIRARWSLWSLRSIVAVYTITAYITVSTIHTLSTVTIVDIAYTIAVDVFVAITRKNVA